MKFLIIIFLAFSSILSANDFTDFITQQEKEYKAKVILENFQQAMGEVDHVKSIITSGKTTQLVINGKVSFPITTTVLYPQYIKLEYQGSEYILRGKKGWQRYPEGYFEKMNDKQTNAITENLKRNFISILRDIEIFDITYLGEKVVNDETADILLFESNPVEFRLIISQKTGLPLQMLYKKKYADEDVIICRSFSSFSKKAGIMFPAYTITEDQDGNFISEYLLEIIQINPKITAKDF